MATPSPAQRPTRRSASFIGGLTLAGRIVERFGAFGQILLIAAFFGATADADLYFIASIAPLTIGGIAGESLHVSILPLLARRHDGDTEELVRAGFWVSVGLLGAGTLAYLVVAAVVVGIAEPAGGESLAPWLAFAPIGLFLGLSAYLSAVLLRLERYVWPPFRSAVATLAGLGLSVLALVLSDNLVWVAAAVTAGYGVAFVLLVAEVLTTAGRGSFARPSRAALSEVAGVGRGAATVLAGGILGGQLFVFVERALAASLGVGAVSAISYARGVAFTPSVLAQSISLGLYPGMLRAHAQEDRRFLRGRFLEGLRITLFVALCTASYVALYSSSLVGILFGRGDLTSSSLLEIERTLAAFSIAIVGSMLMIFTSRVFSAVDLFRGIVLAQGTALALYLPLAFVLRPVSGPAGLALAFGIAEVTGAAFAVRMSARALGVPAGELVRAALPAAARAAVVVAALAAFRYGVDPAGDVAAAGAGLSIGALVALVLLWTSGWQEVDVLRRVARRLG